MVAVVFRESLFASASSRRLAAAAFSILLAVAGLAASLATTSAHALQVGRAQTTPAPQKLHFAISRRPLTDAIEAFAQLSGVQVLYDAPPDRMSTTAEVTGVMTAKEALDRLLVGTGLLARYIEDNTVVLVRIPSPTAPHAISPRTSRAPSGDDADSGVVLVLDTIHVDVPPPRLSPATYRYYAMLIQSTLTAALRKDSRTRVQTYQVRLRLWVAESGRVARSELASSTGNSELDAAIGRVVEEVILARPPPKGMPQPVQLRVEVS